MNPDLDDACRQARYVIAVFDTAIPDAAAGDVAEAMLALG